MSEESFNWVAKALELPDEPAVPEDVCRSAVIGRSTKHIWSYSGKSLGRMVAQLIRDRDSAREALENLLQLATSHAHKLEEELNVTKRERDNLSKECNTLRQAVLELRVLRSSCEDSLEGKCRVHLFEPEFDALRELARKQQRSF